MKFLLTSTISLTNCENPSSIPRQGACSGFLIFAYLWLYKFFRKPPVFLKNVPKAGHECILEKMDQWEPRKAGTEIWCGLRNIFRISKCFQRSRNVILSFLLNKTGLNCKDHLRMYIKYWSDFKGLQKNIHLVTQSHLT